MVTDADCPPLRNIAYWVQFKRKMDIPIDIKELKQKFNFSNVYEDEFWGDAYTYVNHILVKKG